jgi:hypothetical protein
VLGDVDGLFLLATSMSAVAERLEGRIDAVAANGVHWGSHSALVAVVLGSRCNMGLTKGEVDALWSLVLRAADSLASHIPSLVACNPPDSAGE